MTEEIIWGSDFASARAVAKIESKLVMVDFYGSTCSASLKMEDETFQNQDVQKYMREYFVPVKYQSDSDAAQFTKYGIVSTPSFFIFDADGDEVYRMVGFYSPEDFIGQMVSALQIAAKL